MVRRGYNRLSSASRQRWSIEYMDIAYMFGYPIIMVSRSSRPQGLSKDLSSDGHRRLIPRYRLRRLYLCFTTLTTIPIHVATFIPWVCFPFSLQTRPYWRPSSFFPFNLPFIQFIHSSSSRCSDAVYSPSPQSPPPSSHRCSLPDPCV